MAKFHTSFEKTFNIKDSPVLGVRNRIRECVHSDNIDRQATHQSRYSILPPCFRSGHGHDGDDIVPRKTERCFEDGHRRQLE